MAYQIQWMAASSYQPIIEWETKPETGDPHLDKAQSYPHELVPKRGILKSRHKKLPDLFLAPGGFVVCRSFRNLVERFEPDVHQFFEFEVVDKKGRLVPGDHPYYFLNVMQKFDAILADKSEVDWEILDEELAPGVKVLRKCAPQKLVMSGPKISGRHLWRADQIFRMDLYFSDQFVAAIKEENFRGLMFHFIEEIDEEWVPEGNLYPAEL